MPGEPDATIDYWSRIALYLVVGAVAAIFTFRLAQPYAFQGLGVNPAWLDNIRSLQAQSNGDADVPFALQWARRSHLFSFKNLTLWGLGLPLGILAWAGFGVMAWRILKGELQHAVLWVWTGLYFGWQSLVFNPTMRYQLPVYPLLCMMAAWLILSSLGPGQTSARLTPGLPLSCDLPGYWNRRSGADRRVGVCIHTHLHPARDAGCGEPLDLPKRPRTNQSAHPDLGWLCLSGAIAILSRFVMSKRDTLRADLHGECRRSASKRLSSRTSPVQQTLRYSDTWLSIRIQPDGSSPEQTLGTASLTSDFAAGSDPRGTGYTLSFDQPPTLHAGETYSIQLETDGALTLVGAAPINETDWDDGLPLRAEGYDAYGGLYQGDLNLQIYWDDNAEKLQRFVQTLSQGDYIFMSSNRQWATVTRVPERYPLTTAYYRDLVGCPADKDVIWCYNVAKPGMFEGQLGYKLVAVFRILSDDRYPGRLQVGGERPVCGGGLHRLRPSEGADLPEAARFQRLRTCRSCWAPWI